MAPIDELIDRIEQYDEELAEEVEMEYSVGRSQVARQAGEGIGELYIELSWRMGGPFDDGFLKGCVQAEGPESPERYTRLAGRLEDLAVQARRQAEYLEQEEDSDPGKEMSP